jgi:hypothetical protein
VYHRVCTHEFFGRRRRRRQLLSVNFLKFSVDGAATASTESSELRISPSTDYSVDGQLRKLFQCHLLRFKINAVDGKSEVCTTLISRQILRSPSTESSSTDARRKFMCAHPISLGSSRVVHDRRETVPTREGGQYRLRYRVLAYGAVRQPTWWGRAHLLVARKF